MGYEVLVRPERCISCYACEVACAREHDGLSSVKVLPPGVPIFCRHCQSAPCIEVCYTGAFEPRDGEVLFHKEKCTGCELCLLACPFGAVRLDGKRAYKCDLCSHRRQEGLMPACALTCPAGAISYSCVADFSRRKRGVAGLSWALGHERRGK